MSFRDDATIPKSYGPITISTKLINQRSKKKKLFMPSGDFNEKVMTWIHQKTE